jgi:hypothetical protein
MLGIIGRRRPDDEVASFGKRFESICAARVDFGLLVAVTVVVE